MNIDTILQDIALSTDIATQEELDEVSALLSGYAILSDLTALSSEIVEGLSSVVLPRLSVIADLVSAEVERIDAIFSDYVPLSALDALESRVSALESRLSTVEQQIAAQNS